MLYLCRAKMKRRFRLAARTHASHAWNTGSIPVGATKRHSFECLFFFCLLLCGVLCFYLALPDFAGEQKIKAFRTQLRDVADSSAD